MIQKKHGLGKKKKLRKVLFDFIYLFRRSLNLIECLLRIADTGLHLTVLEIFKHGIQRSGELIFLGLLQLHVSLLRIFFKILNQLNFQTVWTTLKQELIQLIIPTFLANSPNANSLLNYMWNLQVRYIFIQKTKELICFFQSIIQQHYVQLY
jgi:hypothetical protein